MLTREKGVISAASSSSAQKKNQLPPTHTQHTGASTLSSVQELEADRSAVWTGRRALGPSCIALGSQPGSRLLGPNGSKERRQINSQPNPSDMSQLKEYGKCFPFFQKKKLFSKDLEYNYIFLSKAWSSDLKFLRILYSINLSIQSEEGMGILCALLVGMQNQAATMENTALSQKIKNRVIV